MVRPPKMYAKDKLGKVPCLFALGMGSLTWGKWRLKEPQIPAVHLTRIFHQDKITVIPASAGMTRQMDQPGLK
jgi:hypothetical protein